MPVPRGGSGMPGGAAKLGCAPKGRAKNGKRRSKGEPSAAPPDEFDGAPPDGRCQREKNDRRGFETGASLTTRSPEIVSPPTAAGGGGKADCAFALGGA